MIKKLGIALVAMALSTGVAFAAWTVLHKVEGNVFAVGALTTDVTGDHINVLKGMPGESVTQTITVKNTGDKDVQVKFNTVPTVDTNGACNWVKLTVSANWWDTKSYGPKTYTVNEWYTGDVIADGANPLLKTGSMNVTVSAFLDSGAPQSVALGNCTWDETFTSE